MSVRPGVAEPEAPVAVRSVDRATPLTASAAVAASSTALAGVLRGGQPWWPAAITVGVVAAVGLGARTLRAPRWAVVIAQAAALVLVLTGLFTEHPVLGVLPGPDAAEELVGHLGSVGGQIEGVVPPVPATTALLVLACLVLGVLAIVVDVLTVAGFGPAACGLVLLCAYTVPTTLSRDALPDWTLVAGASSYAMLLLVDHRRRPAPPWSAAPTTSTPATGPPRPPATGPRTAAPLGARVVTARLAAARLATSLARRVGALPSAMAVTALAVAFALLVGVLATVIGTQGRFSGNSPGDGNQDQRFGLNPFTALRGQLERPEPAELLRVRGLPPATYLRALTLTNYLPSQGWQLPQRRRDSTLDSTLPTGLPSPPTGGSATIEVDNVGYRDRWLPLAGLPLGVTGVVPGRWRYDVAAATAYADGPVTEARWVQRAALLLPGPEVLAALPSTTDVDPVYLDTAGVDPRIRRLSTALTGRASTQFSKVVVLTRYFLDPANGFRYSLRTAPGNSDDALLDFLLRGKVGYCEQFASAMAVMLRTVGVPARVAVGFTPGLDTDGVRSIGTSDAHAWVEVLFPGQGWLSFDPTPLGDGRGVTPDYLGEAPDVPLGSPPAEQLTQPEPAPGLGSDPARAGPPINPQPVPGGSGDGSPGTGGIDQESPAGSGPGGEDTSEGGPVAGSGAPGLWAVLLGLLAGLGAVAVLAAPSTARKLVRRRRLGLAALGGAAGAAAAWREVLAESRDRGGLPPANRTVRTAARRLVSDHGLGPDTDGAVRVVVGSVERGWYAPVPDPEAGPALLAALAAIRTGFERAVPLRPADRWWPRSVRPRWVATRG